MARRLCPFDKQECIGTRCAIFDDESESCALAIRTAAGHTRKKRAETGSSAGKDSRYRAHLFD